MNAVDDLLHLDSVLFVVALACRLARQGFQVSFELVEALEVAGDLRKIETMINN